MTNVTASLLIASSKSLSVTAMMFSGGCFEVVLCAMAMWFESSCSAARTAANGSEVGEIVAPPFPSGTLGMRWPLLLDLEPTRSGSCSPCSHKRGVGCPKLCSEKQSSLVHCCGNGIYVLSASPNMTQLYWLSALYGHCSVQANISIFFDKTHRLKNGLWGIFSKIYANGAFIMTS